MLQFAEFVGTDDEAAAFVDSKNLHRWHLSAEWWRERVRELKAKGMSNRVIAKQIGCDEGTVRNDLKSGAEHSAPATSPPAVERPAPQPAPVPEPKPPPVQQPPPPPRVTGRDGKTYPASKPASSKPPSDEDDKADREKWKQLTDQLQSVAFTFKTFSTDKCDGFEARQGVSATMDGMDGWSNHPKPKKHEESSMPDREQPVRKARNPQIFVGNAEDLSKVDATFIRIQATSATTSEAQPPRASDGRASASDQTGTKK